jgi:hypothetical protein
MAEANRGAISAKGLEPIHRVPLDLRPCRRTSEIAGWNMSRSADHTHTDDALGRGAYGAAEALRLINFRRAQAVQPRKVSRQTVMRWLGSQDHGRALWTPDFRPVEDDNAFDLSFGDLIELRFVKAFRDAGLSLECLGRAVAAVQDARPFSTRRFRTDGKTIFFLKSPTA